jgi:hypothetical protein
MASIVKRVDDVDWAEGITTEATRTVTLQLGTEACELDLTDDHFAQLHKDLEPWFKVAHQAGLRPLRQDGKHHTQNRARNKRMREFADARGISYRTSDNKVQYSRKLQQEFDAWEAGHGPFAPTAQ